MPLLVAVILAQESLLLCGSCTRYGLGILLNHSVRINTGAPVIELFGLTAFILESDFPALGLVGVTRGKCECCHSYYACN